MAKQYKGSLSLDWYNKQKSILLRGEEDIKLEGDIPAPKINWINKDEALFYEVDEKEGKGLTPYWVDRTDIRVKEARPLLLQKVYKAVEKDKEGTLPGTIKEWTIEESTTEDPTVENILIKGDNLLALNTLKKMFDNKPEEEKVKCIYIDPPYNTGSAFENYDDNLAHSEWLTMFRDRLVGLKHILQEGGYIFVQLDDSEGSYGKLVLDDVFGRENYVITMYVQVRYDDKTLKEDMEFNKLIEQVFIYRKGFNNKGELNRKEVEYTNEKFCISIEELSNPIKIIELGGKKVEIFVEGSYKIVKQEPSKNGLKEIWASGSILDGNSSGRFFRDYLTGREKIDGYKTLYKVNNIGDDGKGFRYFTGPQKESATRGKYFQGMPLDKQNEETSFKFLPISNFIDLASYFGNCRHEGGVEFKSGKKPELLLSKLFEIATSEGDYILDCFGGSGSTFGTAHKMKRKWIGVEMGNQADTHIVKRMLNTISNKGKTIVDKEWNWQGGGSFKYYHLGESIIKLNEDGTGDFNWSLGRNYIEEAFLSSYDYTLDTTLDLAQGFIFGDNQVPLIGIQQVGTKTRVAIISLNAPNEDNNFMTYDEIFYLYQQVKKHFNPQYINVFTNRGVEIAYDSKPEDLEVIKIPQAIFAELEK